MEIEGHVHVEIKEDLDLAATVTDIGEILTDLHIETLLEAVKTRTDHPQGAATQQEVHLCEEDHPPCQLQLDLPNLLHLAQEDLPR